MLFENIAYVDENFCVKTGFVGVSGGYIGYVGADKPSAGYGERVDGRARVLIPGLVNAHCHVPMTLLRGYGEGLPLDRWLNERVFPFEAELTGEDVYLGSLVGIAELLASGCTSFSDMYDHCEEIAEAVKISGIRANLSRAVLGFGDVPLSENARHAEAEALIKKWHGASGDRIRVDYAIHAEYTSNERTVREAADFAGSANVGVQVHLSETKSEHDGCVGRRGRTPARYFADCGLFDVRATAAHAVWVTDGDMDILREYGVTVSHNPTSNLKLASGIARVPEMRRRGVKLALGTDGASSNNNLNMLEELHIASILHRGTSLDPEFLPPGEALEIATRSGALSQGREDCGLIKEGYRADLAVVSLAKPHMLPVHGLISDIVYSAQSSDVEMTVVGGETVYRDGKCLLFNQDEAIENAAVSARRIAEKLRQ